MTQEIVRQLVDGEWKTQAADVGGGGGGSGVSILGPFTVNWDDAGVNNNKIDVADLAQGTIIIRAWAFKTEAWVAGSSGFEFSLEIGDAGDTTNGVVLDYPAVQGDVQPYLEEANAPNYGDTRWRSAIVTGSGWKLRASVWVNGPDTLTSGSIDFYALAYVPV